MSKTSNNNIISDNDPDLHIEIVADDMLINKEIAD